MSSASLVCIFVLCLGLTHGHGVPHKKGHGHKDFKKGGELHIFQAPKPQNVFIQGVHHQLPDCPPEINSITEVKTITQTRDVYTTQIVPSIVYRTVYTTNVVTQTSNTVVTVTTSNVIRSNVLALERVTKVATAYTAVATTFTETTTRTQFSVEYVTETSILPKTVFEGQEQFVPFYVTQTAYGVNPITQITTSTVLEDQLIPVTVTFTEQTIVPVVVTETQTLPVPAVTSTHVNYVTQTVQVTQTIPVERIVTHREIHTRTVTEQADLGLYLPPTQQTVYQTVCP